MLVALAGLVALALVPRVVVVRDGSRTVLSVQSDLSEPWPLPPGVKREDAVAVPASAFDDVDRDAPMLSDQWERDPCPEPGPLHEEWGYRGAKPETISLNVFDAPAPPPRRHVNADTTTPGFRVEMTSALLTVPVVAGQEVVIHVLASTSYDATGVPTVALPPTIEVPLPLRGSFPELYGALFEHAAQRWPGVVLREFTGRRSHQAETLKSLGYIATQVPVVTRLHVRPQAGTTQIVLAAGKDDSGNTAFVVPHAWAGPIRCLAPDRDGTSNEPGVPVVAIPTGAPVAPDELLRLDVPSLGLHARPWWRRVPPLYRGSLAGAALGFCAALGVRRRKPR